MHTTMSITSFPNAKINIGLYVVEKRPDGYHNLETIFYPLPVCDKLVVEEVPHQKASCSLVVEGIPVTIDQEDNLIVKAYRMLEKEFKLGHTAVQLTKTIPFGAGLGGGSSDAAFMLKSLNELYQLGLTAAELEEYAVQLGADCAFFIRNTPVFAGGIGNIFTPVELSLKGYQYLLVKPDVHVSTPEAYRGVKPRRPAFSLKESIQLPVEQWKERITNDFETSVFDRHPLIASLKEKMYAEGAVYATMSGSGSSVVGIFPDHQSLPEMPAPLISFSGIF